jgi:hypothetical protein
MISGKYKKERPPRMVAVQFYRCCPGLTIFLRLRRFVVVFLVVDLLAVFVFFLVGLLFLLLG